MQNTEAAKSKKFNKVNLPCLITFAMFTIGFSTLIAQIFLENDYMFFVKLSLICLQISILSIYTLCPLSLIFQFLNKNKNKLDKWLLGLNLVGVIFFITLLIFIIIAFPNNFKGEKDVRRQIDNEFPILKEEYTPVLDYLKNYKKEYGVYPDTLNEKIMPKSENFEMYQYHITYDGKGYWLQIYPKKGPIEYYYNDENDKGVNYYNGDGYIDGALDNDYYYEIDKKWHAIKLQYQTRHSVLWNGGHTERKTDEFMKNNIEKFDHTNIKN